ncbi:MAG TPA: DUF3850 domain-containing protein [Candidatus Paceibacterota bacterium]
MNRIEKKVWPEYFQQILDGKKTFEVRLNDFEINEGDILVLKEWDPNTKSYTGRELERKVGYVGKWKIDELTKFWPRKDIDDKGIQVISLKE